MPETKGLGLERITEVFGVAEEREMTTLATGLEKLGGGKESKRRLRLRGEEVKFKQNIVIEMKDVAAIF